VWFHINKNTRKKDAPIRVATRPFKGYAPTRRIRVILKPFDSEGSCEKILQNQKVY
jgi:hypothetical protein